MKTFEIKKVDGKVEVTIRTAKPVEYTEKTVNLTDLEAQIHSLDDSITRLQAEKAELVAFVSDINKEVIKIK